MPVALAVDLHCKMSFSRAQQPAWQTMIRAAWNAHCLHESIAPVPAKWDRSWYEQELYYAVKKTSTSDCNAGRDYDRAMAHFEALAGVGIKWQMKLHSGDAVRLLHELREAVGDYDIDEDYLRGVAQRMLKLEVLPALETLKREQLILILGEVKRYIRRHLKHARESGRITATPLPTEDPNWDV